MRKRECSGSVALPAKNGTWARFYRIWEILGNLRDMAENSANCPKVEFSLSNPDLAASEAGQMVGQFKSELFPGTEMPDLAFRG